MWLQKLALVISKEKFSFGRLTPNLVLRQKKRNSQMVIVLFFMNGNKQKCVVVSSCTELPDGLPRDAGKPGIVPG